MVNRRTCIRLYTIILTHSIKNSCAINKNTHSSSCAQISSPVRTKSLKITGVVHPSQFSLILSTELVTLGYTLRQELFYLESLKYTLAFSEGSLSRIRNGWYWEDAFILNRKNQLYRQTQHDLLSAAWCIKANLKIIKHWSRCQYKNAKW